jgi:N utilization substance protein A
VPYDNDPARFVCNAIAPAQVSRVMIDAANHTMELVVADDKLSLAIGKKGQNVRLASQLTNWRIDIHSETKMREAEDRARASLGAIEGATPEILEALLRAGWGSAEAVSRANVEELGASSGLGSAEASACLIAAAGRAAAIEEQRRAEDKARVQPAAAPVPEDAAPAERT